MMETAILALGLYKGSGGPSKSVWAMQQALQAGVISWVDPLQFERERLIWEESTVVRGSRLPVLRQLLHAPRSETREAEDRIRKAGLVSCHTPWRGHLPWMAQMKKKHGVPFWFVPHGGLDPYVLDDQPLVKRAYLLMGGRRAIEEADCVVFTTRAERDKAAKCCRPARSEVVYWPLGQEDFATERSDAERWRIRSELGIPENARCLLLFGRLHPMKRPLETIEVVAGVAEGLHLLVVGNEFGVSLERIREQAERLGVSERVHLIGPVYGEARADYFAAADAYVSLSHRENFNFTAAESMAAGLPVILSPGNDLGGEMTDADCGWLLEDDALGSAVELLKAIAAMPLEAWHERGANGRRWAQAHLRFGTFQERIRSLAEEIAR